MVQRGSARWVLSDYSFYSSVSDMLGRLSWRTIEKQSADSRLVLFYKIVYDLVAIPLPAYFIHLGQHTHWLSDNSTIKTCSSHWHWYSGTTFQRILTMITLTLLLLSVKSGTSDHKSKYRCFYPQLSCFYRLIYILGNTLTLCTFIMFRCPLYL